MSKTALITGASRGIGAAIAKRLGRKEDAVRQQLSRGRKMLIQQLEKKEDN